MGKAPKELEFSKLSKMKGLLNSLDDKYSIEHAPLYAKMVNYSSQPDEPIHRWFRYREGYSTKLIESLIKDIPPNQLIVDPFCGSGTTLLVARQLNYPSIGIDVNPLSIFVAKTKTRKYTIEELAKFVILCSEMRGLRVSDPACPAPELHIIDKVFLPEVLRALLVIKSYIENKLNQIEHDFFLLAWLSILEKVSNVFREGNGIKYRNRKRTPTGYLDIPIDIWQQSIFPEDKFDYVLNIYIDRVKLMINDVRTVISTGNSKNIKEPEAFIGDALNLDDFVENNSTELVVFSPPYANNFNYFKAYKVELWMGDFVTSYQEMQEITHSSLRSHVETRLSRESDSKNWYPEQLDALIELIDMDTLWTPRIIKAIKGYFYDMHTVIENIYDCLSPNGKCAIVVGNSAYGSILIPTDVLLAETASVAGMDVENISVARHLTTSSQQKQALEPVRKHLRESILILRKPKSNGRPRTNENGLIKYRYVSELPRFPRQSSSIIYVIKNKGLTDLTHIIHKYPGKFIPHIPRWAIEKYLDGDKNKVILDPFCGSGTTLIEGMAYYHTAYGIDIDPLARKISKVKTTPVKDELLIEVVQEITDEVRKLTDKSKKDDLLDCVRPSLPTLNHWFTEEAISGLGKIRSIIDRYKNQEDIYDFLVITFSSIIRRVSNADNQSLKTYVSGTNRKVPQNVGPLFIGRLYEYSERIAMLSRISEMGGKAKILDITDSRHIVNDWRNNKLPSVDLGITSPPYIKTVDYIYNQMVEYFWIGDLFGLENQEKQNKAKQLYIGTEKVSSTTYKDKRNLGFTKIDNYIDQIYETNPKHAYIMYKYFFDMNEHLHDMHKIMRIGSIYVMVIGNSTVSNIVIPTLKFNRRPCIYPRF